MDLSGRKDESPQDEKEEEEDEEEEEKKQKGEEAEPGICFKKKKPCSLTPTRLSGVGPPLWG